MIADVLDSVAAGCRRKKGAKLNREKTTDIFPCYSGSMLVLLFLLAISGRGSEPMEVGL